MITLQEKFDPGIKGALMSNFNSAAAAILEWLDNCVDDRIDGVTLVVTIRTSTDRLVVINKGGWGMGVSELETFLNWGRSEKVGKVGRYGQGGKAALGYLGKSIMLRSKKRGEDTEYILKDSNWDALEFKSFPIEDKLSAFNKEDGIVQVEIAALKKQLPQKSAVCQRIGNVYRPLLERGVIKVTVNGENVEPAQASIESQRLFQFSLEDGRLLTGWVGLLPTGAEKRGAIKSGVRCYRFGRLICDGEYFGHRGPTFKQSLGRLIGEIDVQDFVAPNINKTDFDRDDSVWKQIEELMHVRLKPLVDGLLRQKDEERVSDKEKNNAKAARDIMLKVLRRLELHEGLQNLQDYLGGDRGQKRPEPKGGHRQPSVSTGRKNQPRTPPPSDATGKRRRLGESFSAFDIRVLDPAIRSDIEEKDTKRTLIINKTFPAYKKRNGDMLYLLETAALELAKVVQEDNLDIRAYCEEANRLLSEAIAVLEG